MKLCMSGLSKVFAQQIEFGEIPTAELNIFLTADGLDFNYHHVVVWARYHIQIH